MIWSYVDLARIFSRMICESVSSDELATINALNKTKDYAGNACATHNFFDANQTMIDALEELNESFDSENVALMSAVDHAWSIAKAYEFDAARIPDNADSFDMWANGCPIVKN